VKKFERGNLGNISGTINRLKEPDKRDRGETLPLWVSHTARIGAGIITIKSLIGNGYTSEEFEKTSYECLTNGHPKQ